jgi:hypothetical protein
MLFQFLVVALLVLILLNVAVLNNNLIILNRNIIKISTTFARYLDKKDKP